MALSTRRDQHQIGTRRRSRNETRLNGCVHRELRGLIPAEGEGARHGRNGQSNNRDIHQRAISGDNGGELNKADRAGCHRHI